MFFYVGKVLSLSGNEQLKLFSNFPNTKNYVYIYPDNITLYVFIIIIFYFIYNHLLFGVIKKYKTVIKNIHIL